MEMLTVGRKADSYATSNASTTARDMQNFINDVQVPTVNVSKPVGSLDTDQFWEESDESPRPVGVSINVTQLSDIVVTSHSFKCNLTVYLDWPATMDEARKFWRLEKYGKENQKKASSLIEDDKMLSFRPYKKCYIKNASEVEIVQDWKTPRIVWVRETDKYFIKTVAKFRCTCLEAFELERFPMDVQDLSIRLQIGGGMKGSEWAQLVPITTRNVQGIVQKKYSIMEDCSMEAVYCFFLNTNPAHSTAQKSYSHYFFNMKILRNWKSYFYRMACVLSSISVTTLAAFSIDADDDLPDRIAHITTMILTAVAFMFIVYSTLPPIPYLTYMDHYTNSQFFYMLLTLFFVSTESVLDIEDITKFRILLGIWIGMHVILFLWFGLGHIAERKKIKKMVQIEDEDALIIQQMDSKYDPSYPMWVKELVFPSKDDNGISE